MAVCEYCKQEMADEVGCTVIAYQLEGGRDVKRVPYGSEPEDWGAAVGRTCHDCACPPGTRRSSARSNSGAPQHHVGCDVERCPVCGGQAISCECPIEMAVSVVAAP